MWTPLNQFDCLVFMYFSLSVDSRDNIDKVDNTNNLDNTDNLSNRDNLDKVYNTDKFTKCLLLLLWYLTFYILNQIELCTCPGWVRSPAHLNTFQPFEQFQSPLQLFHGYWPPVTWRGIGVWPTFMGSLVYISGLRFPLCTPESDDALAELQSSF